MKTHHTSASTVSPFVAALRVAILKTVRELQACGSAGCTLETLALLVPAPSCYLDGAPTLAAYTELFREEAERMAPEFILETNFRGGAL